MSRLEERKARTQKPRFIPIDSTKQNETSENSSSVPDVVLNFDNADIYEVLNVFSEILGINYLVDPRVKGTVTIRTTGKINREQLMGVFHNILELNGVGRRKKERILRDYPLNRND